MRSLNYAGPPPKDKEAPYTVKPEAEVRLPGGPEPTDSERSYEKVDAAGDAADNGDAIEAVPVGDPDLDN